METYNLAKDREGQGKLLAMRYAASDRVHTSFGFNLTHKDPVLREIFRDNRFRFATSYALNREQMNELVFNGLSRPWQDGTPEGDPFYHERLSSAAIEYDPEKANALLDEMGLEKGSDGFPQTPRWLQTSDHHDQPNQQGAGGANRGADNRRPEGGRAGYQPASCRAESDGRDVSRK